MARVEFEEPLPALEGEHGWFVLAPPADPAAPGELLARLRTAGHAVQGFVDRAALLAAAFDLPAPLLVLELARARISISVATHDGQIAALRRQVSLPGGTRALTAAWLELTRATLVQQTRFDPLHDQRHESQLREQLPRLAAEAQQTGQAETRIETGAGSADSLGLTLTRDQFAVAAAPVLRPLAAALQSLSAANDSGALLVPEPLLDVPGIDEALVSARLGRMFRLNDAAVAQAAALLPVITPPPSGAVPYRTQLSRFTQLLPADTLVPLQLRGQEPDVMATHVVYRGRALPLTAAGLVVGRDPGAAGDAGVLQLPDGVAGLSRRHCTLCRAGGRSQIIDHSSHGSFLDGARVHGRALLPAGSLLKLGDPGIELHLVALDGAQ